MFNINCTPRNLFRILSLVGSLLLGAQLSSCRSSSDGKTVIGADISHLFLQSNAGRYVAPSGESLEFKSSGRVERTRQIHTEVKVRYQKDGSTVFEGLGREMINKVLSGNATVSLGNGYETEDPPLEAEEEESLSFDCQAIQKGSVSELRYLPVVKNTNTKLGWKHAETLREYPQMKYILQINLDSATGDSSEIRPNIDPSQIPESRIFKYIEEDLLYSVVEEVCNTSKMPPSMETQSSQRAYYSGSNSSVNSLRYVIESYDDHSIKLATKNIYVSPNYLPLRYGAVLDLGQRVFLKNPTPEKKKQDYQKELASLLDPHYTLYQGKTTDPPDFPAGTSYPNVQLAKPSTHIVFNWQKKSFQFRRAPFFDACGYQIDVQIRQISLNWDVSSHFPGIYEIVPETASIRFFDKNGLPEFIRTTENVRSEAVWRSTSNSLDCVRPEGYSEDATTAVLKHKILLDLKYDYEISEQEGFMVYLEAPQHVMKFSHVFLTSPR